MAKQLKVNRAALNNSAKQATAAAETNMKDARKQDKEKAKPIKSNADYLRLDLVPTDEKHPYYGIDFKEYVTTRAKEESRYPNTVSATRYIQNLIFDDMQSHKGKAPKDERHALIEKLGKHKKVIEQFSELSEQDKRTAESVIDALLIRARNK